MNGRVSWRAGKKTLMSTLGSRKEKGVVIECSESASPSYLPETVSLAWRRL